MSYNRLSRSLSYLQSRRLSHALKSSKAGKSPISFTPNASVVGQQSHETKLKESEEAVPNKPALESVFRIYRDMVKPEDACDLLWRPKFEDYLTSCLAKECPLLGDTSFRIVSKSSIHNSDMMFANIAIAWIDLYRKSIYPLKGIQNVSEQLSYTTFSPSLKHQFSGVSLASKDDFNAFFDELLAKGFSLETIIQYSLSKDETGRAYEMTLNYLNQNLKHLNPNSLTNFTAYLVGDVCDRITRSQQSQSSIAQHFDRYFIAKLLKDVPGLVNQLDVSTLDKLSHVSAIAGNFTSATQGLAEMCQHYKIAPSNSTWEVFVAKFGKNVTAKNLLKSDILISLAPLKPVFFHHPLTPNVFNFLLNHVVHNVHDLSHLVQLARSSTPQILQEKKAQIIQRLEQISIGSEEPQVFEQVRLSQLKKYLEL